MNALDEINTRRLALHIREQMAHLMTDFIVYPDAENAQRMAAMARASVDQYIHWLQGRGAINAGSVTSSFATGYLVRTSKRGNVCAYPLSDGKTHVVRKKFGSRRTARVHGKRNWKHLMFVDMVITPVAPAEYITINVTVNNEPT